MCQTKQDRIDEVAGELKDVLRTSGLWILLRGSDKTELDKKAYVLASSLVEKAIPE